MKINKNILIVSTVRNCSKYITKNINILMNATDNFRTVKWLIIESDSTDNTSDILKNLQTNTINFNFLSLGHLSKRIPLRTERIAHCRNKYLKEIKNNKSYKNIDYIFVVDLDQENNLLDKKAILSCFKNKYWDVCTANQSGPYYDIWPLRHSLWSPNDCYKEYHFYLKLGFSKKKAHNLSVYSKMITISKSSKWIRVQSAFGGIAIYKKNIILKGRYSGKDKDGNEISEHVSLNTTINNLGYKIFINPELINFSYNNHSYQKSFFRKLKIKLKNLLI